MSVYCAHDGRDKLYNYIGNLQNTDTKGISGDIILHRGAASNVSGWKTVLAESYKQGDALTIPTFADAAAFDPARRAENNLKKGFGWYQAQLPVADGRVPLRFNFRGLAEKAIVFINGKQVAQQQGRNRQLTVNYDGDATSPITITVFGENRAGQNNRGVNGPLSGQVDIIYRDDLFVTNWAMKGGPGDMNLTTGWKPLAGEQFDRPYLFKNTFTINHGNANKHAMWRISFEGLSHGFVFVNGHNIGGYPERIPIKGLYIPECWLKEGANTVVVYDQYGNRPDRIMITPETVASRDVQSITL